jgi:hypothetical protein
VPGILFGNTTKPSYFFHQNKIVKQAPKREGVRKGRNTMSVHRKKIAAAAKAQLIAA